MTAALKTARATIDAAGSAMRLGVYANAFAAHGTDEEALPANDGLDEIRTDLTPTAYLDWAKHWRAAGADIIGGCCGVGPEHIAALAAWRAQNA
jgi:homocysteine S-methyltransferase family protein